ncbi:hypothetical protein BDM02DRAFT_3118383 [Thelephora ganbajun]|uniref:Uncharacterized protein n=1 Tax=Thelephora ganbajun TaxID=370292 RepID=A0ACB6ZBN9_THEGA|nr:hypothetical protein BDM02DRAFT_3118383 [Thelephora ganbajun]
MIAIAGTIGTGLFLGTSKSLAQGGPASILIAYSIVGFVVYVTLLLLGEMATQYPVAGSFNAYAHRFFSPSYSFALSYNYWFNDAVSVASDLIAAQILLQFWTTRYPWVISLVSWVFLVGVNATDVGAYGELEYWLASLKVATIVVFIVIGIVVNVGGNTSHEYIGGKNWRVGDAPFVGDFGGFAHVFITASFAYGGTESLGITAGETKNPSKNMPRVVKAVFWRILIFYVLSVLIIGLNVPYNYPGLSTKSTATSPFTIIFEMAGSRVAGSFVNTVIITTVLSGGNHALFAGTRVLYSLAVTKPVAHAPKIFAWTTKGGVPLPALLATSSISVLCFGSSYIGNGQLWSWLQNIVGVSNQIAWLSIGLASWRFRKAWIVQGRPIEELKFNARWTWPWGPYFVMISVSAIILIQGWSSVFPKFSAVDFVSLYLEIPMMIVMWFGWIAVRRLAKAKRVTCLDNTPLERGINGILDIIDLRTIDLTSDEYQDSTEDDDEEALRQKRMSQGGWRFLWRIYYLAA